ncbi:MAG: hypothetical protein H6832_14235 [Planctomycetes bacterium]|nr:hypothetical protein [Planctomycetota bacterium]MCB9919557.1 hypothetical protein [Planctomycetota bacterium]
MTPSNKREALAIVGLCLASLWFNSGAIAQVVDPSESPRGGIPVPRVGTTDRPDPSGNQAPPPSSFGIYDIETSRALFRACDLDANDQLLPREATRALKNFDWEMFRSFDTNSDGRIEFDEFDKRFKELTLAGGDLTLQDEARKRLPPKIGADSAYPPVLISWFANLDTDGSDRLGKDEFAPLAELLKVGEFQRLDKNLDDGLSIEEMRPLIGWITLAEQGRPRKGATRRQLPEDWRSADLDNDNLIDQTELERALFRIDPMLVSHGRAILQSADKNSDLFLDVIEVTDALSRESRQALEAIPEGLRSMDPERLNALLERLDKASREKASKGKKPKPKTPSK